MPVLHYKTAPRHDERPEITLANKPTKLPVQRIYVQPTCQHTPMLSIWDSKEEFPPLSLIKAALSGHLEEFQIGGPF